MSDVMTAADLAYSDTIELIYMEVKETIAGWMDQIGLAEASDRDLGQYGRPGIPGTQKALDRRIKEMIRQGWPMDLVSHLIEIKVREAYGLGPV